MEVTGYTVQKLTRQYAVTRLATAGDEPLAEGLRVETTPLRTLANTILDDYGLGTQPAVAKAFETRFLRPLKSLSFGVLTISASTIRSWADAESTRRGA